MKKFLRMFSLFWEKGVFHIFSGTFLLKIISFFGSIFLVRALSKQDYGILGYLENIYGYAFVLAGMGASNAILRYVILGESRKEKYKYFSYAYRHGFLWNIVLILIVSVICMIYPHPEAYKPYTWLLYILLLGLPFQYLCDNVLCNERAMFSNQRYAFFSLVLSSGIIVGKVIFGKAAGIMGAVFAQSAVYAILALFFFCLCRKKYYTGLTAEALSIEKKREINLYSFQYMITNGLWAIFMLNDTFLLGRFCAPEVIANYKVAYTIPGSVSLISSALGIFIAPYFVKNENNRDWIKRNFARAYGVTSLFVGSVCIIIAILAKPVVLLLYGEHYLETVGIMRILLVSAFCNCGLRFTTANILAAMGKVKYNMMISALGMVAQIGLNLLLIPQYSIVGVAVTSCIVYLFMALSLLIIFVKQYYLN